MKITFFSITCLFLLAGLVGGCGGGDKKRPPRKQLPALTDEGAWEGRYGRGLTQGDGSDFAGGQGKVYYYTKDTVIGGQSFISLSMPDPAADSLAWVMVKSYEPFASGAFLLMQQQGKKGAVINLRSTGEEARRASFVVKDMLGNALSLTFLWDKGSSIRASGFINELKNVPAIQYTTAGDL